MEVDGFWIGASRLAERAPVSAWAEAAGGWDALRAMGPDGWRALGLSASAAEAWARQPAVRTRGTALVATDPRYPRALASLPDAPPVLYVEGALEALGRRAVAVVGTRACTGYGRSVARDLGGALAAAGVVVVSGLARGIDAEAHRGALARGCTVAVLGHGLAHTAPQGHRALREQILAAGGAMLTTWPDAAPPRPWAFPSRNRWIAGLSERVVVVEAPERSGAMHTVRAAADYGREVFAVPGPLCAPASVGCLRLIAEGVEPLVGVAEFVQAVTGSAPPLGWLEALFAGGTIDAVARGSGRSVAEILAELHLLEARGEVVRLPGQRYARA